MWITRPNYYNPTQLPFETYDLDTTMSRERRRNLERAALQLRALRVVRGPQRDWPADLGGGSSMPIGKVTVTRWNTVLHGSALSEGATNKLVMWGKRLDAPPDRSTNAFPDVALEYFDATYWRKYNAHPGLPVVQQRNDASATTRSSPTGFADSLNAARLRL
jgi:hypothetical protein